MAKQTQQAVAEADVVVFVLDARAGLSGQDHEIGNYLRRLGKPTLLIANKAEGMKDGLQLSEFYELGLGEVMPVSAAHGQGVRSVVDAGKDKDSSDDDRKRGGINMVRFGVSTMANEK